MDSQLVFNIVVCIALFANTFSIWRLGKRLNKLEPYRRAP